MAQVIRTQQEDQECKKKQQRALRAQIKDDTLISSAGQHAISQTHAKFDSSLLARKNNNNKIGTDQTKRTLTG